MSRSEGSRLLGAVEQTQAQIAARVGVSRITVAKWVSGERLPSERFMLALRDAYRIPLSAWPSEFGRVHAMLEEIVAVVEAHAPEALPEIVARISRSDTGPHRK